MQVTHVPPHCWLKAVNARHIMHQAGKVLSQQGQQEACPCWLCTGVDRSNTAYVGSFLSINPNFALVQVWDQDPIALRVRQVLRLPLDLVCDSPPLLYKRVASQAELSPARGSRCFDLTCRTITAGFVLIAVAHPGMLFPKVSLARPVVAISCVETCSRRQSMSQASAIVQSN